jgi:arylsulfatase
LRAVKWRNWKMHLIWEPEPNVGPNHLEAPYLFNLIQDPKEETDVHTASSWARTPMRQMIHEFQESLKAHPPILPGAPDDYIPKG